MKKDNKDKEHIETIECPYCNGTGYKMVNICNCDDDKLCTCDFCNGKGIVRIIKKYDR